MYLGGCFSLVTVGIVEGWPIRYRIDILASAGPRTGVDPSDS